MLEPLRSRCRARVRAAGACVAGAVHRLLRCVALSLADGAGPDQAARRFVLSGLLLAGVAVPVLAGAASEEAYPLPDRGKLRVMVPADWQVRYVYTQDASTSPTLHVYPLEGKSFEMTVTVYWHDGLDEDIYSAESLLKRVQQAGEAARADAGLESQPLDIHRFEGLRRPGFFYDLHDTHADAGEFAFLTQGAFVSGRLVLAFTLLTDSATSPARARCLDFLRSIRHDYAFQGVELRIPPRRRAGG